MDRLTGWVEDMGPGIVNPKDPEGFYDIKDLSTEEDETLLDDIADRLARYEDTNLTPVEIIAQRDELAAIRVDAKRYQAIEKQLDGITIEQFADLCMSATAKADGGTYRGGRLLTGEDAQRYYDFIGGNAKRYDAIVNDLAAMTAERDLIFIERNSFERRIERLKGMLKKEIADLAAMTAERDALINVQAQLNGVMCGVRAERDAMQAELDAAKRDLMQLMCRDVCAGDELISLEDAIRDMRRVEAHIQELLQGKVDGL